MARYITIALLAVSVLLLALLLALRHQLARYKETLAKAEEGREAAEARAKRLEARVALLEGELRIKAEVKEETSAKVNDMLAGDALGNALDVLHKRPRKVRGQDGGSEP